MDPALLLELPNLRVSYDPEEGVVVEVPHPGGGWELGVVDDYAEAADELGRALWLHSRVAAV